MAIVTLQLTVRYDRRLTTEDDVCAAMNKLLETATSTPGVLEEVGNPSVDEFEVAIGDDV